MSKCNCTTAVLLSCAGWSKPIPQCALDIRDKKQQKHDEARLYEDRLKDLESRIDILCSRYRL